jgi:phage gp29-like protein
MSTSPLVNLQALYQERRTRFNPLANFTPERLTTAIQDFRAGRLRDLSLLMEAIEETDDTLMTVAPKAKAAVARHGWEVLTVETDNAQEAALAAEQQAALKRFYNEVRATNALDQDELGGMSLLLRQMMDAKGKRYSVHNIVWKPHTDGHYSATFWHVPLWCFENTTGRMRYLREAFAYDGEAMDPGAWLVTRGLGISIACTVAWAFKHLPLRDWLVYCERHGMPGIEGVTDAAYGSEAWNRMVTAVASAAREFAWVRSRSDEIKTIEFAASGELPYPALVERMDRALASLWRGADLSTISAGGGTGQGASLQGGEAELIEQDDAQWLSETLNMKVDRLVLDNLYGPETPALAYVKILSGNKQDVARDLQIDAAALASGHPVSKKQFAERYNRPLPDAADELLHAPSTPAFPGAAAANEAGYSLGTLARQGRSTVFQQAALQKLGDAQRAGLAPLIDGLAQVDKAETPEAAAAALRSLQARLPALYAPAAGDRALASAFEEILGAAVVSGLVSAPQAKTTDQAKT